MALTSAEYQANAEAALNKAQQYNSNTSYDSLATANAQIADVWARLWAISLGLAT